jgi:two-component system cell cycle response regulator
VKSRILVVEDNAENMELMVYLLQSAGYAVSTATDGAGGLEAAGREHPGLVLCDMRMPVLDGLEVARRLKGDPALRDIRLVAVTASASGADRNQALAAGFDDFITKPIDPVVFLGQVEEFLHPSGEPDP